MSIRFDAPPLGIADDHADRQHDPREDQGELKRLDEVGLQVAFLGPLEVPGRPVTAAEAGFRPILVGGDERQFFFCLLCLVS